MPIASRYKTVHGEHLGASECSLDASLGSFHYVRVEAPEDLPAADERIIDVALLDLNHGWHNLGHDSLVHAVLETSCDLQPRLLQAGLSLRVISFAVRHKGMLPEPPSAAGPGRYPIYLGTGGPGHLDPRCNDGISPTSQGIKENPAWEAPAFALFDAILADPAAVLLAVCHTFGVLCRWAGVAEPVARGAEKGGKLSGVVDNVLTDEALRHPWFSRFVADLVCGRKLRILDNRLFDLIPAAGALRAGFIPIGHEAGAGGGCAPGDALTMMELARDREGLMPRVFGVNHHPEIVDRARSLFILRQKMERGEVSAEWARERLEVLDSDSREDSEASLQLTSDITLLAPLRFHLYRQIRLRAAALGRPVELHEDEVVESAALGYDPSPIKELAIV
jgi:hypothetical protein